MIKERHRYRFPDCDKTLQALCFPEQGTGLGSGHLTRLFAHGLDGAALANYLAGFINDQMGLDDLPSAWTTAPPGTGLCADRLSRRAARATNPSGSVPTLQNRCTLHSFHYPCVRSRQKCSSIRHPS